MIIEYPPSMRTLLTLAFLASLCSAKAQVPFIDYSFAVEPPNSTVNKIVVQPDGRILVGGSFFNYAGTGRRGLLRLMPDGSVDPTFNPGGSGPSGIVYDIALMDDGRIVIGGSFLNYNGQYAPYVLRLLPDGTRDPIWTGNAVLSNEVRAVAVHDHYSVVAAGEFNNCSGFSAPHIVRFTYTGDRDTTFDVGTGLNALVTDLEVLPDGRILAAGDFTQYKGNLTARLARIHPNADWDSSLVIPPFFFNWGLHDVELMPDGRMMVAGRFHGNGVPTHIVRRLHPDGSLDNTFTSPFYPYTTANALHLLPDGRVLLGGEWTTTMGAVAGAPIPAAFISLLPDGTIDPGFNVGTGAQPGSLTTAFVNTIATQPDGRVLLGGWFGAFDVEEQFQSIIRLDPSAATGIAGVDAPTQLQLLTDPHNGTTFLLHPFPDATRSILRIHAANGQLMEERFLTATGGAPTPIADGLPPGLYIVSVEYAGQRVSGRLVRGVW